MSQATNMKTCTKCKEEKSFSSFNKRKAAKDGHRSACRECEKAGENKERMKRYTERYNRARGCRPWEQYLEDRRKNPIPKCVRTAKRRAQKKNADVSWADNKYIQDLYRNAKEANKIFEAVGLDPRFQVDHIVPLQHKDACGLHVEFNLQIVPRSWNIEKGNKNMAIYC